MDWLGVVRRMAGAGPVKNRIEWNRVAAVRPSVKTNFVPAACLTLILTLTLIRVASAESIVFPADAGVKNVNDYGVRGDGGGFALKPMAKAAFAAA